jgi:hypothetical protein
LHTLKRRLGLGWVLEGPLVALPGSWRLLGHTFKFLPPGCVLGWAKRRNPPPGRFRRWVWKLALAFSQFLPSPEAPVVLIFIMVVDVVVEMDDIADFGDREAIDGLIELARDNMTERKDNIPTFWSKFKILLT